MKTATIPTGPQATEGQAKLETLKAHILRYSWSISRGRDTYGYNLLTLREDGQKVASTCGGGYDMQGTVLADWLLSAYPERMKALASIHAGSLVKVAPNGAYIWTSRTNAFDRVTSDKGQRFDTYKKNKHYSPQALSGLWLEPKTGQAVLDGACGINSVQAVIKALGLTFKEDAGNFNRKTGRKLDQGVWTVSPSEA